MGVGDAQAGSPTSRFLDEVVHAFNSMGHRGYYLDESIKPLLESIGFRVDLVEPRAYPWRFASRTDMLDFCRLLFGMDRQPTDGDLLYGIKQTVGFRETAQGCELNWELMFVRAVRGVDSIGGHR